MNKKVPFLTFFLTWGWEAKTKINSILISALILITLTEVSAQTNSYPFPQNVQYTYGLMPAGRNHADVQAAYEYWKSNFVTSSNACGARRVIFDYFHGGRGATDRSHSVSEGIAYGMLIAAYMGDQSLFDDLWRYYKMHRNGNGVMHWKIKNCNVDGANGASDAELDVAMALIVASYQWQSDTYVNDAKSMIRIIREKEFEHSTRILKPGDMFGGSDLVNPSYFSPAYYRAFKAYDPGFESFWDEAAAKGYEIIERVGGTTGLVPDWCTAAGGPAPANLGYEDGGKNFIYDGVRTPFRSAIDYLWWGNTSAKAYCDKFIGWAKPEHGESPAQIGSKYGTELNGNEGHKLVPYHNNTFVGCFAVASMAAEGVSGIQKWLDDCYTDNKNTNPGDGEYFNASFKVLSLLVLTGNFYLPPPDQCTGPELGDDRSLCAGSPLTLNAGVSGRTYVWKRNNTIISGQTAQTLSVTQPGIYEVIATDPSGCVRRDKVEVFASEINVDFVARKGAGSVTLTNTSTGGISDYSWKIQGGSYATATEFSTTRDAFIDQLGAGSYQITLTVNNSGYGCTGTGTITKTVIIGDGNGVAMDDFNYLYEKGIVVWDLAGSPYFTPIPKKECSRADYEAGKPKECFDLPCSYLRVIGDGKGAAAATYTPFGIEFVAPVGPMNLSSEPYVSIKLKSSTALELGVKLQTGSISSDPIFITLAPGVEEVFNLDFNTITTGWDNSENSAAIITAYDAVSAIQFVPFQKDNTWNGTIDIDWIIIGGKTLPLADFDVKRDDLGFTEYGADGNPLSTWTGLFDACNGPATVVAQSCTADEIQWYSGTSLVGTGSSVELAPGMYTVHLINQGGIKVDTAYVKGANLTVDFTYALEDNGKGLRLFNNSTDFDGWTWSYGVTPSDPAATKWEEGYNYYTADGTYNVCLTVTNSTCGTQQQLCKDIEIKCHAPLGAIGPITSAPTAMVNKTLNVCPGIQQTISIDSVSNATSYGWFGTTPTSLTANRILTRAFTTSQTIKIEAYNLCGEKVVDSFKVNVIPAPVAKITTTELGGQSYSFEAQWIGDVPDATYSWEIDGAPVAGNEIYIEHTFSTPGVHSVKLTASNSCGTKDTTISVGCELPNVSAANITGTATLCQGETCLEYSVTGITGATSYSWTLPGGGTICTGAGTTSITGTPGGSGVISVVPSNACGAGEAVEFAVTVNSGPITSEINGTSSPTCGQTGVTYSVTPTQGSTYNWTVPDGAAIVSGLGTASIVVDFGSKNGNITVTETNQCVGQTKTLPITLVNCDFSVDFEASVTTVCEGVSVTFTSLSTGVSENATYNWNFGTGATPATATGAGPHTVVYTGGGAKTVSLDITQGTTVNNTKSGYITVNPKPATPGTITGPATICANGTGTYSIAPVAGATGYTWSGPTGSNITGSGTSVDITFGTASGSVSVTADNGCGSSTTASTKAVTLNPAPVTSEIQGSANPGCNSTETYQVTPTSGSTYTWTYPAGASIVSGQGTATVSIKLGSSNGNITVQETSSNGCKGEIKTKAVSLTGCDLTANFEASATLVCQGAEVTFTNLSTGASPAATYSWNFGTGATPATATGPGPHTVTYSSAGQKSVSLSVTDGATVNANKNNYITVNPLPDAAGTINGQASVCAGSVQTYSISAVSNATSYTWTVPSGSTFTGTGTSISVTFGSTSGNVTVTPTNSCGTGTLRSLAVAVNAIPQTSAIQGPASPACGAQGVTYSVTNNSGSTYTWTVPSGSDIVSGQGTNSITVNFGTSNGNVTVEETNASSCKGQKLTRSITMAGCGLSANFSASSVTVCEGTQVTFTDLSTGTTANTVYTWNFGTGATPSTATGKGPHNVIYSGSGKRTVSLSIDEGGVVDEELKTEYITVNPKPAAAASITGESTVCPGAVKSYTTTAATGATSYTWTVPGGATFAGTGTTISVTFGTASGNITVTPTNSCGTGTPASLAVTVSPAANTSAIDGNTAPACNATGITYSVLNTPNSTYQWSVPSGTDIVSGQGTNSITVNFGSTSGNIGVIETTEGGCTGTQKTLAVVLSGCGLNANFSASTVAACAGSEVTFTSTSTAAATATYSWNFGDGATPATATGEGPHKVVYNTVGSKNVSLTVTEGAATDVETKNAYITVGDKPASTAAITGLTSVCSGVTGTYSVAPVAGATSYKWTAPAGSNVNGTGNSVQITFGSTSGPVTVAAENACGTATASTLQVEVNSSQVPSVTISVSPSETINSKESVTFTATPVNGGETPSYTWYINDNPVFMGSATYTTTNLIDQDQVKVVMVSSSACATTPEATSNVITMTVNTPPPGYAYAGPDQTTCLTSVTMAGNTPDCNGTGQWSFVTGTGNIIAPSNPRTRITGLLPGTYVLKWTVTSTCGGELSDEVQITVNKPAVDVSASADHICEGTSVTFTANIQNGVYYQWLLSGAEVGTNSPTYTSTTLTNNQSVRVRAVSSTCPNDTVSSTSVLMKVDELPTVADAGPDQHIAVAEASLSANANTAFIVGQGKWTRVAGEGTITNDASKTTSVTQLALGSNTFRWTISNGVCPSSQDEVIITVGSKPATQVITGPSNVQANSTGIIYSVPASSDVNSYTWTVPSGATIVSGQGTNQITVNFGANATGTISVTMTNQYGSTTSTKPINSGNAPQTQAIVGPGRVSPNGTATYSITPASGSTIVWNVPSPAIIISGQGTAQIVVQFTTTAIEISVTETNSFGNATSSKNVVVSSAPVQEIINGPSQVSPNSTVTYSVPNNPGSTYNWTVPDGATIVSGQGTNEIQVQFGPTVNGTVSVTETNSAGSATSSLGVTGIVGVRDAASVYTYELYPNPFADETIFRLYTINRSPVSIRVIDIKGIPVAEYSGLYTNQEIKLGKGLRSGVYTLQVNFDDRTEFFKLIKVE